MPRRGRTHGDIFRSGHRGLPDYGATSATGIMAGPSNNSDVTFAGFSPTEFMSLSESITPNISAVQSSLRYLEKAIKSIGTQRDTKELREKM